MIVEIIALVVFAVVTVHTYRAVTSWLQAGIKKHIDARLSQIVVGLDTRFNTEFPKFCAETKTHLHQSIENMLAKDREKPDNAAAHAHPDSSPSDEPVDQLPFWKNRDKLRAAREVLEQGDFDLDAPDLAGMAQLDAARAIDAALLELELETSADNP